MSVRKVLVCVVFMTISGAMCESELHNVLMEKATSDLESSASGYIYRQDGKGLGDIVYLNSGEVLNGFNGKPIPYTLHGDSNSFGSLAAPYNPEVVFHHPSSEYKHPIAYAQHAEYLHAPSYSNYDHQALQVGGQDDIEDGIPLGHHSGLSPYTHINGHAHHGNHESGFLNNGGSNYGSEQSSKHGLAGSSGYKKDHEFNKGEQGHHDNAEESGYYEKNGGMKGSKYEEGEHHDKFEEGSKESKGGKFGEKKHHRKGSKTTGYHNVFHKDEYKKDHTFYDDGDHTGHFNKYGSGHEYYSNDEGKRGEGGHHQTGFYADHHGKKGYTDKGHYDKADSGYKGEHGLQNHHSHNTDYSKHGGAESGGAHGYKQSGGHYH